MSEAHGGRRPNILFLMPDQLRADFLGCYGAGFALTPHIDALAARGTRFDRCLSTTPICVPARASLLTGTTSLANGILVNGAWLRPDRRACGVESWPERLGEADYETYAVGKMHFYPFDASEGFGHRVICEDKRQIAIRDDYAAFLAERGKRKLHGCELEGYLENGGACVSPLGPDEQVDLWCADEAIGLLERHDAAKPFAMMVGFPSPHCPYDPPPEVAALFDPADIPAPLPGTPESEALRPWLIANMKNPWADIDYSVFTDAQKAKVRAHYSALIHIVDQAVGRLLDALERLGLADNTVVVFGSDHGDFVGDYSLVCKNFFMDPSVRVPMILAGPGIPSGTVRGDTVHLSDLYPTFLELAGERAPAHCPFTNLLAPAPEVPRTLFGATHRGFMVERGRRKFARYIDGPVTLHDLDADPGEQHNLAEDLEHRALREDLDRALTHWIVGETLKGHLDKTIVYSSEGRPEPGADPTITERGWSRPYPWSPAA